ncbi:hypothetical protein [Rhizobium sp. CF142]|uniref:hypothetical protein n=1 Tax=Rhizobium sp. CF142 TaxID=1144314 RepID=UPI00026EFC8F|nr:hypothetical protein [Rhizobium sp. CF142]EJJ31135.1 hypothetical protein PMI11_00595 [Rhizobium sp. CF142]
MNQQYAKDVVDDIYDEGDRDIIFFGHILSFVTYDKDDKPYDKSPDEVYNDAKELSKFLISNGDFSPGLSVRQPDGSFKNVLFEGGFDEFNTYLNNVLSEGGIDCIDLIAGPWLMKNNIGESAPIVPGYVADIFR